jgi:hypothetical protein
MERQFRSLVEMNVWILVELPPDKVVLDGRWVYDEKYPKDADPYARARWVVRGDQMKDSYALEDLYAAVAHMTSVRLFCTVVALLDLDWGQYDAVTAFLNAKARQEVYMKQPQGFDDGSGRVCLLKRALYGLPTAPLWWFDTARAYLKELGFAPLASELCLFRRDDGVHILLYVDDMIIAAPTKQMVKDTAESIALRFKIKEIGEVTEFLGLEIKRDRPQRRIWISQEKFIDKIVEKFFPDQQLNKTKSPWPSKTEIPANWKELDVAMPPSDWLERTGSLNFLSMGTRPDITYTVQRLCEANQGPTEIHVQILKHIFRYISATKSYGICLGGSYCITDLKLRVYADASFATDPMTRFSTAGHIVFVAEGPIHWKSAKQTLVTTSTTEAEFINLTPAGMSLLWISQFLADLKMPQPKPLVLFTDSQNARLAVLNKNNTARTRHIDIRYKWIINRTNDGFFQLHQVGTDEMTADGLTKALTPVKHAQFIRQLNLGKAQVAR